MPSNTGSWQAKHGSREGEPAKNIQTAYDFYVRETTHVWGQEFMLQNLEFGLSVTSLDFAEILVRTTEDYIGRAHAELVPLFQSRDTTKLEEAFNELHL